MEIFFTAPTGARVGESIAQTINVILESLARACREFDSNKDTPRLVRSAHEFAVKRLRRSTVRKGYAFSGKAYPIDYA